jgi:hypothetical protein
VVVGQGDWLYFTGEGNMDYYQRSSPYSSRRLDLMVDILTRLQKAMDRQGIVFWVVVSPAKESIYPDYLPAYIQPLAEQSRLDQLSQRLQREPGLHFLDLRGVLTEARQNEQVFYRTDTHWNDLGAFLAYQEIMRVLARDLPELQAHPLSDFSKSPSTWQGDLARTFMLGLIAPETTVSIHPKFEWRAQRVSSGEGPGVEFHADLADGGETRLLIFGDSFMSNMVQYLAEHFSHTLWKSAHTVDLALVWQERPTVVIYELNERYLDALLDNVVR